MSLSGGRLGPALRGEFEQGTLSLTPAGACLQETPPQRPWWQYPLEHRVFKYCYGQFGGEQLRRKFEGNSEEYDFESVTPMKEASPVLELYATIHVPTASKGGL